jgi:histidine triad (HIT) family protein
MLDHIQNFHFYPIDTKKQPQFSKINISRVIYAVVILTCLVAYIDMMRDCVFATKHTLVLRVEYDTETENWKKPDDDEHIPKKYYENPDHHEIIAPKLHYKNVIDFYENATIDEQADFFNILISRTMHHAKNNQHVNLMNTNMKHETNFSYHVRSWHKGAYAGLNETYTYPETIFEKIIQRLSPAKIFHETEYTMIIDNIKKRAPIHELIIPKKHYRDIIDFYKNATHKEKTDYFNVLKKRTLFYKDKNTNIVQYNGKNANKTVFHLHYHITAW